MNLNETTSTTVRVRAEEESLRGQPIEQSEHGAAHADTPAKKPNSLDRFCETRPDALECRIYDV